MQFIQNKINIGKTKSFDDICQDYLAKKNANVKTASTKEVKVAEVDEAEGSGQLEVEPLHQKGESTTMPKNGPSAKKEGKENKADKKEESVESKEEVKEEVKEKTVKEAKELTPAQEKLPEALKEKIRGTSEDKEEDKCEDKEEDKEEDKCEDKEEDKGEDKEEDKGEDKEEDKGEDKEASTKKGFKKIANLTSEEKTKLGNYWRNFYPPAFVDALLANK